MIRAENLSKTFDGYRALDRVNLNIEESRVFGLVGTNGAGKSTLMRLIAGVFRPDEGAVLCDGRPTYDNPGAKADIFYVSDDQYFLPNSTPAGMESFLETYYRGFDRSLFRMLLSEFDLNPGRRISEFSKGMKKQLSIILAVSSGAKYILLDETFDGLDPVMRQAVKSLFAREVDRRGLTPVISSHNLRELEDICDNVGLIHKGAVVLSEDLENAKSDVRRIQCVFAHDADEQTVMARLKILQFEKQGRLCMMTVRGTEQEITEIFSGVEMVFFEILPLTLEEIFIAESEGAGYDVRKKLAH